MQCSGQSGKCGSLLDFVRYKDVQTFFINLFRNWDNLIVKTGLLLKSSPNLRTIRNRLMG